MITDIKKYIDVHYNDQKIASKDKEFIEREIYAKLNGKKIINAIASEHGEGFSTVMNLRKNGFDVFPIDYRSEYNQDEVKAEFDKEKNLYYVPYKNLKLYMRPFYKKEFRVKRYFNNLLVEKDKRSPHAYVTSSFAPSEDDVIIDIGGAEGIFSADYIYIAKHIYIFECDPGWAQALRETFSYYKDKVTIIEKFVSDVDDDMNVSLDSFLTENKLLDENLFIKIDAEGNEPRIINGFLKTIDKVKNFKMSLCTYHKAWHNEAFKKVFNDYVTEESDGYMIYYYDYDFDAPYLRKGILRVTKNDEKAD